MRVTHHSCTPLHNHPIKQPATDAHIVSTAITLNLRIPCFPKKKKKFHLIPVSGAFGFLSFFRPLNLVAGNGTESF